MLETIKNFRGIWEEKERQNLTHDRDHRLGELDFEKEWIEQTENIALGEEEEKYAEDGVTQKDNEGNGFQDEESKELYNRLMRLLFTAALFKDRKEWKSGLLALAEITVLKNPRIMQSIFYLLGYKREQVCQEDSNKFFWKIAKKLVNDDFLDKLADYTPFGLKTHKVHAYQTINFLEKNIEGLGTQEDIEAQCGIYVGRLYKWLTLCLKVRKDEITYRKAQRQLALSMRDGLIQKEKER